MQARQRGYLAKQRIIRIKYEILRQKCAVIIQCAYRCYKSRLILAVLNDNLAYILKKAAIVTSFFRIVIAKSIVRKIKKHNVLVKLIDQIRLIQTQWRIFMAKTSLFNLVKERQNIRNIRRKAARCIQCMARMTFAKTKIFRIKQLKRSRGAIEEKQSIKIQKMYRGLSGRILYKLKMGEVKKQDNYKILCACRIQRSLRRHWLVRSLQIRTNKRIRRKRAVTVIQALGRGFLARLQIKGKEKEEECSLVLYLLCFLFCLIVDSLS